MNRESNGAEIDRLLKRKDFATLYNSFVEKDLSSNELLVFYLKNQKVLFSSAVFWNAELPHFHLREILDSSVKVHFIKSYLSEGENCNHALNQYLSSIAKEDFIRFIKLLGAFKHANFLTSLKELSENDSELQNVVKEFEIILMLQKRLEKEIKEDEHFVLQYSFGEIALAFSLYHEDFKLSPETLGNRNKQVAYEMTLVNALNNLFSLFKGTPKMTFKNPGHQFDPETIFPFIKRLIQRTSQINAIELYQSGYLNFQSVSIIAPLKTNENYSRFKINDLKSELEEYYLCGFDLITMVNKKDISGAIKFWEFYNLPQTVGDVDIRKLLKFLRCYSIDIPNDGIRVFDYEQLLDSISETFEWTREEAQSILSDFTFDIHAKKYAKNWLEKPFIREEAKLFWLGTFLKDRRWEVILLNRLKREQGNLLSENFERKIEEVFRARDFKTISREKFKSSNGEQGDFDVLAFKDHCLLVCEAKTRTRSDDFIHAAETEAMNLEGKAVFQLEKAVRNIRDNWDFLREKLGIEEKIELDSMEIIPLIITDFFEGDLRLYEGFYKVSLLELDVIINNRKKELYDPYRSIKTITDRNNSSFLFETNAASENDDLWNGETECSVKTLIKNIQQNTVWKDLERVWKFEPESMWLDYRIES
ncbi:hypothetical protein [Fluviicola sp.]|uniref:hypothetical protein n=1 Tax=Fluviicola sp. TaxID=1917219 RepID=UPI0031DA3A6F